jgi:glucose/arabinose dehydrogenase
MLRLLAIVVAASLLLRPLLCQSVNTTQQSCTQPLEPVTTPIAASGFSWDILATNVTNARGIVFDSQGRLLVVQQNIGIIALTFSNESCAQVTQFTTVLQNNSLNHGIQFSSDSRILYASSSDQAWSWEYNATDASVSNPKLLVSGMNNPDHSTRTLQISPLNPNLLIVSRGSNQNIDLEAGDIDTGRSQVKVFNLSSVPEGGYDFTTHGEVISWGVRNEVGLTNDRQGNIWGVLNGADQLDFNGVDVSKDNPAEELHYCSHPRNAQANQSWSSNESSIEILWISGMLRRMGSVTFYTSVINRPAVDTISQLNI